MTSTDIKAAFFDIDGTLTSFTTHVVPESTIEALRLLRDGGVKLFICSGRAPGIMNIVLDTIPVKFDGIVGLTASTASTTTDSSTSVPLPKRTSLSFSTG